MPRSRFASSLNNHPSVTPLAVLLLTGCMVVTPPKPKGNFLTLPQVGPGKTSADFQRDVSECRKLNEALPAKPEVFPTMMWEWPFVQCMATVGHFMRKDQPKGYVASAPPPQPFVPPLPSETNAPAPRTFGFLTQGWIAAGATVIVAGCLYGLKRAGIPLRQVFGAVGRAADVTLKLATRGKQLLSITGIVAYGAGFLWVVTHIGGIAVASGVILRLILGDSVDWGSFAAWGLALTLLALTAKHVAQVIKAFMPPDGPPPAHKPDTW